MGEPVADYSQRAAFRPRPPGWREPDPLTLFAHTPDEGMLYSAAGQTFWADISVFQPVVDGTYPYPMLGFRADSGTSTDGHATANWAYADIHPDRIRVALPYVVFQPGQSGAIFTRLRNLFGSDCPPRVVPEIDMESGSGFAGPGDHSVEANDFLDTLAGWSGGRAKTEGYGNGPDWAGSWPGAPSWVKKRLAWYSVDPTPAGYYARQYYGALPYASPAGYPRACAPFGSYVDMNVTPRTITQIEADYGIGDAVATVEGFNPAASTQLTQIVTNVIQAQLGAAARDNANTALNGGVSARLKLDRNAALKALPTDADLANLAGQITALAQQVTAVRNAVAAISPATGGPVTGTVSGTITITPTAQEAQ
jgi:hypothetical protein